MTPPLDVPRKLRQLDDDVREIYGMLAAIATTQQRHGDMLESHREMLEAHSDTLASQGGRLELIDGKIDTVLELLRGR